MQSPRILIVRLSAIGDVIQSMPIACALRERFPQAFLAWAVEEHAGQLLEEVVALSPSLGLTVYDLNVDKATAEQYRVDKAPAFVVAARDGETFTDTGIQYSGIPSGHEFSTLIQDIVLVASRDSGLKATTREYLKALQNPIHLQVFVTPTCPYCPRAVVLAHQMAMENPGMIRAEGVESMEFQELAEQFHVSGVPQTTINSGKGLVVGAVPEANLLAEIQRISA